MDYGEFIRMTPELQKYYENRLDMMGSQGWKDLMEDVETMLAATNNLDGVDSSDRLFFKKGEVSIIKWILGLKEMSEKAFEELKNEA